MNAGIIAQQIVILFLMMLAGYVAFKKGMIGEEGTKNLSSLILNIFGPCLLVASVLNKEIPYGARMVAENVLLVAVFFMILIFISRLVTSIAKLPPEQVNCYRLMLIFPNLGFMGIPLVQSVYGGAAVIFVAFYMMAYNFLIYTYGILLAAGAGKPAGGKQEIPWRKMCNMGTFSCIIAVLVFAFPIRVPKLAGDFVAAMGNASVPLSMMAVGIMIAKSDLKSIIMDKRQLLFMAINMLVIPILCIPVIRLLPIDEVSYGIFVLMMAMPVGSMAVLIEKEYGHSDGTILAQSIALSSVVSVITIPAVTFFA